MPVQGLDRPTRDKLIGIAIIAGLIVLFALLADNGKDTNSKPAATITRDGFLCRQKETMERVYKILAGDKTGAVNFMERQIAIGECALTPPIGTPVRIEDYGFGLICIAPIGSANACRWTSSETAK